MALSGSDSSLGGGGRGRGPHEECNDPLGNLGSVRQRS